MNPEEAIDKLKRIRRASNDTEGQHVDADAVLLEWARSNGGTSVADAYDAVVSAADWWACA